MAVLIKQIRDEFLYKFSSDGVYSMKDMTDESNPVAHWCESLYVKKAADLLLYGRALGLSHSEAEDVLQETFMSLMRTTTIPAQIEHYSVRCFRNRAINYRRTLWRRISREFESGNWFEKSSGESPHEASAMRCLAQLAREQREVIVLKIWHQYTFQEIADLLDVSPNTVAGRYRYGLRKLKDCLKGELDERLESFGNETGFLDTSAAIIKT
jgi:RNA polymerase sigma-70 factor (ECF subfamily)